MAGILPETTAGALVYRDAAGNPTSPANVENAYPPAAAFAATCALTALPSDCTSRIEPRQMNAVVSELLAFAEYLDPNGPWNCASLKNLCDAFAVWAVANAGGGGGTPLVFDGVTIVGAGTAADPHRVDVLDCGRY